MSSAGEEDVFSLDVPSSLWAWTVTPLLFKQSIYKGSLGKYQFTVRADRVNSYRILFNSLMTFQAIFSPTALYCHLPVGNAGGNEDLLLHKNYCTRKLGSTGWPTALPICNYSPLLQLARKHKKAN